MSGIKEAAADTALLFLWIGWDSPPGDLRYPCSREVPLDTEPDPRRLAAGGTARLILHKDPLCVPPCAGRDLYTLFSL